MEPRVEFHTFVSQKRCIYNIYKTLDLLTIITVNQLPVLWMRMTWLPLVDC
jgi:hypothetical protein